MWIKQIAVGVTVVALTTCANMEYPKDWSPLPEPGSGCLSLAGTYRNTPSSMVPEDAPVIELRQFLQPTTVLVKEWHSPQPSNVESVTIEQDAEVATITERGDGISKTTQLRLFHPFAVPKFGPGAICGRSFWVRQGSQSGGAIPGAFVSEGSGWTLTKSEDGSIAVQLLAGRIGVIMIVPFGDQRLLWYRYDPVR